MTRSTLDNVPGLGEVRRKALLRHFGSVKRLAAATVEEIAEVPGIGRRTAEAILAALNTGPAASPAQPEPSPEPTATVQPEPGPGSTATDQPEPSPEPTAVPVPTATERESSPPPPEEIAPAT